MRRCDRPLRTGDRCVLDTGHRGRHSSVGFYCDGCGQMRRSRPVEQFFNPWDGIPEAQFCFMCVNVEPRHYNYRRDGDVIVDTGTGQEHPA